jgi:hypothetical protein
MPSFVSRISGSLIVLIICFDFGLLIRKDSWLTVAARIEKLQGLLVQRISKIFRVYWYSAY